MDNISKPIIETKDGVNDDPFAFYDDKASKQPDPSEFYVETPISINGYAYSGTYKVGQKLPVYRTEHYEEVETMTDRDGKPVLNSWNEPITRTLQKTRRVQLVIDEKFMKELLSRSANAKAQEDRIYKKEGIRMDFDDKTGNVRITRKL